MEGKIDKVNWPDRFPQKPEVSFSLENCGNCLKLHFNVREKTTIASAKADFDEVWKDSCCEFFIMFEGEDRYYNLETSCNGCKLLAYRKDRHDKEDAPLQVVTLIKSTGSIEAGSTFQETALGEWALNLEIPVEAFWKSGLKTFNGVRAKGNFYKCCESSREMHFLSWAPISTEAPDFHRPEFFKEIIL